MSAAAEDAELAVNTDLLLVIEAAITERDLVAAEAAARRLRTLMADGWWLTAPEPLFDLP